MILINTLRARLTISYTFVILIAVVIISILSNVMLEKLFKQYVMNQQTHATAELIDRVQEQYDVNTEKWHLSVIENLGMNALSDGLIVKIVDSQNRNIWDATLHNNGQCQDMIENMAKNMYSLKPNFKGNYVENKYELKQGGKNIGSVSVGYYGPYYFTDNDLYFVKTLNNILVWVAVGSIFFSFVAGAFMSRILSVPISKVDKMASEIAKGNFGIKVTATSSIKEIKSLVQTVNNLSDSLEHLEKLRKRLTSDVAHELRTPLSALRCNLDAMIDGIWKPDKERLESCQAEIIRMTRLVEDMQELTNIESERMKVSKSDFVLSELITQIFQNFEPDFKSKGIALVFADQLKGSISADKDKLAQILVNLTSNALKYSNVGGVVTLTTSGSESEIFITIEDAGIGIPKEDLPYIFERFYRVDKSRNREVGGSGIGLAIVHGLVLAHGGKISAESELGRGTKFVLTLPRDLI